MSLVYTADEFALESRRIETLVWESLCVASGERVLLCGYGSDGEWARRAIAVDADVTVIEHRDRAIREFSPLGATLLRGSTSVIPASDESYDLAIAFHYLHETDPFFHAQIVSELARVARRVAIVEPSPPADPLGKRISLLYSQAKRELGQFEYYQTIDYWKRLLRAAKNEVSQYVFAFAKVPPHEYVVDTVDLLLDTMKVEEIPAYLLDELHAIARRSGALLLPPARFVVMGGAPGSVPVPQYSVKAQAQSTPVVRVKGTPPAAAAAQRRVDAHEPAVVREPVVAREPAEDAPREVSAERGYEFPPFVAPQRSAPAAAAPKKSRPAARARTAEAPQTAFGVPFAMPSVEPAEFDPLEPGWQWEPPEEMEPAS